MNKILMMKITKIESSRIKQRMLVYSVWCGQMDMKLHYKQWFCFLVSVFGFSKLYDVFPQLNNLLKFDQTVSSSSTTATMTSTLKTEEPKNFTMDIGVEMTRRAKFVRDMCQTLKDPNRKLKRVSQI